MSCLRGKRLWLTVDGASHASQIAFALHGFPNDFVIDGKKLAAFMERRAPGRDKLSTSRKESDIVHWVLPGCGYILNENVRPGDYGAERTVPRPGHADFPQFVRYGRIPTGGGSNSGRLTAAYCAAGGVCLQYLESRGISVAAKIVRCGDIEKAKKAGDSVGGVIECEVKGVPVGLGGAMFDGLDGEISKAVFGIPGVKGVEFGNGFAACDLKGSQNNDAFVLKNGEVRTRTNNHGGILGGFSSGMPIVFRVAMKPTPTVFSEQDSVDLRTMKPAKLAMKGRHDPCIVRRAVPVVEALAGFVLADTMLAERAARSRSCLTLTGPTLANNLEQLASQRLFTDLVELRVDLLSDPEIDEIAAFLKSLAMPAIVTYRLKADGGAYSGDDETRARFFRGLLKSGCLDRGEFYFDFEDGLRNAELEEMTRTHGVRIIRSAHFFGPMKESVAAVCRRLTEGTDEIAKVAFMPESAAEVGRAFAEASELENVPHVICAMGSIGLASRALAVRTGSMWTYCSCGALGEIGLVSPFELVRTYRFRTQTRDYSLYGVTGWPLKRTMSPELHNSAFLIEDADAVMAPFPAATAADAIAVLRDTGMRGMAVTIPHKETLMPLLDEISPEAREIGAVNTIAVKDGKLVGYNTDADGFSAALTAFLGRTDLSGTKVAVLGAGGASKAVVFALKRLGAEVEIFHRRTPPAATFEVLVNATPVDPIPDYVFSGREAVYDLVYLPEVTPLMARAKAAGCRVENGLSMLMAQARGQRKIWEVGQ